MTVGSKGSRRDRPGPHPPGGTPTPPADEPFFFPARAAGSVNVVLMRISPHPTRAPHVSVAGFFGHFTHCSTCFLVLSLAFDRDVNDRVSVVVRVRLDVTIFRSAFGLRFLFFEEALLLHDWLLSSTSRTTGLLGAVSFVMFSLRPFWNSMVRA